MNRETKAQNQLNLPTLKRIDNAIIEVVANSAHVAVYKFEDQSKSWTRRDVEGSLFVVRRSEQPFYRLLVLNRLSTENLLEDVSGPYMIYRNHLGVTTGIWFYEESEKEKINALLHSIQDELAKIPAGPPVIDNGPYAGYNNNNNPSYPPPSHYPPPPSSSYPLPPSHTPPPPSSAFSHHPPGFSHSPSLSHSPSYPPQPPLQQQQYHQQQQHQQYQQQQPQHTDPIIANLISQFASSSNSSSSLPLPPSLPPSSSPSPNTSSTSLPTYPPPHSVNPPPGLHHQSSHNNLNNNLNNNFYPPPPSAPPAATTSSGGFNFDAVAQQIQNASQQNVQGGGGSPKLPSKAFAYDANSPFPKLLSPSNLAAKTLLQQPTSVPPLTLTSSPLINTQSGIPSILSPSSSSSPSSSPSLPPPPPSSAYPPSLPSSSSSSSLGGSGGVRVSKQQLQQALINLVNDDRFIDLVYNEYLATQKQ